MVITRAYFNTETVDPSVVRFLFDITRGHPGLLFLSLLQITSRLLHSLLLGDLMDCICSTRFYFEIKKSRAFIPISVGLEDKQNEKLLREVVDYQDGPYKVTTEEKSELDKLSYLVRLGALSAKKSKVTSHSVLSFASPLLKWACALKFYKAKSCISDLWMEHSSDVTLFRLVLEAFSLMSPDSLRIAHCSKTKSRMSEYLMQHEFFRACKLILCNGATICPEVVPFYSSHCKVDFFIRNKRKFIVEFMSNSTRLIQNSNRFTPNGIYSCIPHEDWLLLDIWISETLSKVGNLNFLPVN